MATEERQPWQENDYQQAQTLVKRLQETIDRQQQEIDRLKQRDTQLCAQTDSLRKQRDDLRVQNAQLTAEIANLSRRNSLSMLHSGLAMLQNRSGSPDRSAQMCVFEPDYDLLSTHFHLGSQMYLHFPRLLARNGFTSSNTIGSHLPIKMFAQHNQAC